MPDLDKLHLITWLYRQIVLKAQILDVICLIGHASLIKIYLDNSWIMLTDTQWYRVETHAVTSFSAMLPSLRPIA